MNNIFAISNDKPPDVTALEDDCDRFQEELDGIDKELKVVESKLSEVKSNMQENVEKMKVKEKDMENLQGDDALTEKLCRIDKATEARRLKVENAEAKMNKLEQKKGEHCTSKVVRNLNARAMKFNN